VLRRYVANGSVSVDIARAALDDLGDLDIARYAHEPFLPRVWELRTNVTAYDAVYLAVIEVLS
jgi:predicted nucleic acid-binding protein